MLTQISSFNMFKVGFPQHKWVHHPTCHSQPGMFSSAEMIDWVKKKSAEWWNLGCGGGEYQSNILQNHMENCSIVIMQPEGFQEHGS